MKYMYTHMYSLKPKYMVCGSSNTDLLLLFRFFRIVHAPLFFRFFASDRRHMKDAVGNWTAQPPVYDPIIAEGK